MSLKFSIVTCTRNSMGTLAHTIESVQTQLYKNVEHVFVDGGSTDGTLRFIAERCPEARLLLDITGGISRAMNAGLAAAAGDVVAFLHSDDFYTDERVLARVAHLCETTGGDWVVGRTDDLREGKIEPGAAVVPFSRWRFLSRGAYLPHPSTFMRTDLLRRLGGFDESVRYAMDIDCWIRALRVTKPILVDEPLAVFREHSGSLTSSNRDATIREEWRVRRRYIGDALTAMPLMYCRMLKHVYFP
jgi:glycosyltransferase involved in cell wall biosynthesis